MLVVLTRMDRGMAFRTLWLMTLVFKGLSSRIGNIEICLLLRFFFKIRFEPKILHQIHKN